jgi:hypothetical protein
VAHTFYHAVRTILFQWQQRTLMNYQRMVPGVLFTIAMLFQPESPRWLVQRGRSVEAAKVLAWVGQTSPDDERITATIDEISADFADKKEIPLRQQFLRMGESRPIALRCFIPSLVMFFQQVMQKLQFSYCVDQYVNISIVDRNERNQLF